MRNGSHPTLFDLSVLEIVEVETATSSSVSASRRSEGAKRLASRLNKLRKQLPPSEAEFDPYLAQLVKHLKTLATVTEGGDRTLTELVLGRIEHCAHTVGEIAEDLNLVEGDVKPVVARLLADDLIERRERLTIGGSANQWLLMSKRNSCGCR